MRVRSRQLQNNEGAAVRKERDGAQAPRLHKQLGNTEQAREYLTKAMGIFERLGTLIEPDKVRKELADLPM